MNVLFVNRYCGHFGGVEQNVADAAEALRRRGIGCHLACRENSPRTPESYTRLFDGVEYCPELGARVPTSTLAAMIDRLRPEAVYVHKVDSVECFVPYQGKVRLARMVHDHDICCPRRSKCFRFSHRVCRRPIGIDCLADLAFLARDEHSPLGVRYVDVEKTRKELRRHELFDVLLVASRFMRDELLRNGLPPQRITVLPPAVRMPPAVVVPVAEQPTVLFVGQLTESKGVHLLLGSLRQVEVPWRAVIVGDGPDRERFKSLCRRWKLDDRVRFAGWAPRHALGEYYAQARLVVVPSLWPEPFGMVGLEAMLHARPVVAFDVGGISDWLENGLTGVLVSERNTRGLAGAIEHLLTDRDEANRLGRFARRRLRERFDFDRYIDDLQHLLLPRLELPRPVDRPEPGLVHA